MPFEYQPHKTSRERLCVDIPRADYLELRSRLDWGQRTPLFQMIVADLLVQLRDPERRDIILKKALQRQLRLADVLIDEPTKEKSE